MKVKKILTLIQVLLILFIVVCCIFVGKYFYDCKNAQAEYENLQNVVDKYPRVDASGNYIEERDDNGILLSYSNLYEQNNDMVGWIKIYDTKIDYPVVRGKDNEYYIHRDFSKNSQYSGIPFMDYESQDISSNYIIYAHNMKDGSMFADLLKYEDKSFYDSHNTIIFDNLYERGEYQILGVFTTKVGADNEFRYHDYANITDGEKFSEYIKKVKELSCYDTGITAEYGDKLITLSTCAYHTSNERFVVVAKKIIK